MICAFFARCEVEPTFYDRVVFNEYYRFLKSKKYEPLRNMLQKMLVEKDVPMPKKWNELVS